MEELKVLIEMIGDLPQLAIWVLIFFFIYKVIIVGSVFGVLKLFIEKLHDVLTGIQKKGENIDGFIDGVAIAGCYGQLKAEILRIRSTSYIHSTDVEWLHDAITEHKKKTGRI